MKYLTALFAGLALTLAGCAAPGAGTLPTVSPSQPHGIVSGQLGTGADRTHPVEIIAINGVNVPTGGPNNFTLAPGDYTIRLRPTVRVTTEIGTTGQRGPRGDHPLDLHLRVEENMRYIVAAEVAGPHVSDWRPVVRRADPIARR
jgi:hypothetical protein